MLAGKTPGSRVPHVVAALRLQSGAQSERGWPVPLWKYMRVWGSCLQTGEASVLLAADAIVRLILLTIPPALPCCTALCDAVRWQEIPVKAPEFYQRVTDDIIREIEAGNLPPWLQPWARKCRGNIFPKNAPPPSDTTPGPIPMMKTFAVFNVAQCDGLWHRKP